jgi:hypothetical protein
LIFRLDSHVKDRKMKSWLVNEDENRKQFAGRNSGTIYALQGISKEIKGQCYECSVLYLLS